MTARVYWSVAMWTSLVLSVAAIASLLTRTQRASTRAPELVERIAVDTAPVPFNPNDLTATAVGDFRYAGGLVLSSRQTDLPHEMSDIVSTGQDRFAAVGDEGVLLEGRLVLDEAGHLAGVADASLRRLVDDNGGLLAHPNADAEGLALLPTGDLLVSFETRPRIWLYPKAGELPRAVPSPPLTPESNAGMEALTADPDVGTDAYVVGIEDSGETWRCRVTSPCVKGPTVDKPREFGLVSMRRLPDGMTVYLLRAYDPVRLSRITLKILRDSTVIARMDLAAPMTVDNFEGVMSVPGANGRRRFYLLSDDNNSASQRTLLLAFDWQPSTN
jgi:hypothetical protein